jgi:hypothetical protein
MEQETEQKQEVLDKKILDKLYCISKSQEIILALTVQELKNEELLLELTKLKVALDDLFAILRFKKSSSLPYIIRE